MQAASPELVWRAAGSSYPYQGRMKAAMRIGKFSKRWLFLLPVCLFAGLEPGCTSVPGEVTGPVGLLVDSAQGLFTLGCV